MYAILLPIQYAKLDFLFQLQASTSCRPMKSKKLAYLIQRCHHLITQYSKKLSFELATFETF